MEYDINTMKSEVRFWVKSLLICGAHASHDLHIVELGARQLLKEY